MTRYENRCGTWLVSAVLALSMSMLGAATSAQGKGTIRIAEGDWTSNLVQVNIAKTILEEHMGYDVELIFADYTAQWVSLASDDLHIAMEIWEEATKPLMAKYLEEYGGNGEVTFLGSSGLQGRSGYFVPTYVIEGDSERGIEPACPQLENWEQLNECAEAFATIETAPKGRWMGCPVVGWGCNDEARVKNLGLDFVAVTIGSEPAHWAQLKSAYSRGEPILIEGWTPHWVFAKYGMTKVDLPPATDECWVGTETEPAKFDCDFPQDTIVYNIGNPRFLEDHPDVDTFLRNWHLTNEQIQPMLLAVDVDERDLEEVASEWVSENESVWKTWLQ